MQRTKVRMSKTQYGSDLDDLGVTKAPQYFHEGDVYEVAESLAKALCEDLGVAERVDGSKTPPAPISDPSPAAPDKFEGAPENKAEGRGGKRRR